MQKNSIVILWLGFEVYLHFILPKRVGAGEPLGGVI